MRRLRSIFPYARAVHSCGAFRKHSMVRLHHKYQQDNLSQWRWNPKDKSREVRISKNGLRVNFHPTYSTGTAGIRGTIVLDSRIHYWEMDVSERIFGTSIMFGVASRAASLDHSQYLNQLGLDEHGWGLSHKGLLWHRGRWSRYTTPFRENCSVKIGMLFNGISRTLTYFKNKVSLGVAFYNIPKCRLFPCVSSTVAKSQITLKHFKVVFGTLKERCRYVIVQRLKNRRRLEELLLPLELTDYLTKGFPNDIKVLTFKCPNVLDY